VGRLTAAITGKFLAFDTSSMFINACRKAS
jgi:hypothetical protein